MEKDKLILQKARLKLLEAESKKPDKKSKIVKIDDERLFKAIQSAKKCIELIPIEEKKLQAQIDKEKEKQGKHWETKVAYYQHHIDVIKTCYPLYAEEAERREKLINKVNSGGKQAWEEEKRKCKEDTIYWFHNYAWTVDPRNEGLWAIPFIPYDFQEDSIHWMEELIFEKRASGLIEKSRDLGFTWIITSLLYKHWQFRDDGFHALLGTITEDDCDKMGNPSTMFQKLREQGFLQPAGLIPEGWDREIAYMRAINPETENTIIGSACNHKFGRSGRYTVIFLDEFSAVQDDTQALTACSQSSRCKIYNSTVRGMSNEFARIRHSNNIPVKTYHWKEHPYKTDAWYNYERDVEIGDPTIVAQELDIDYTASTPNRIYTDWDELHHVVTESEIMNALPEFRGVDGKFRIPLGHKIVMGNDWAQAVSKNVVLWFVTLRKGTITEDGRDLSGTVLCYREEIMPKNSTVKKCAKKIHEAEGAFEPRMIVDRLMSHEALTERNIYEEEYNLVFRHWNTDFNAGVSRVKEYLELVDTDKPHPFREPTRQALYPKTEPVMGRPNLMFVVVDEEGELMYNDFTNKFSLSIPKTNKGMREVREEFPIYHIKSTDLGKEVMKQRPRKVKDDAMDVVRCLADECFAPLGDIDSDQELEEKLPDSLKKDNIMMMPTNQMGMAFLQRQKEIEKIQQKEETKYESYRDKLWSNSINN